MKRVTGLLTVMLLAGVTAVAAQDNVVGSSHDMTDILGGAASTDEVCKYCHAPHNRAEYALWNRAAPAGPYTMYNAAYSPTMDMTVGAAPGDASMACLSCHDGTIAYDAYTGNPTPDATVMLPANAAYVGTDLTNDHPVGVTYDNTLDTSFNAPGSLALAKLYGTGGDQVECASCHNPHDQDTHGSFLIASNAASALCTDCHIK